MTSPRAQHWRRSDSSMPKESVMQPANLRMLTINGGSSSIKFALFEAGDLLRRILEGGLSRLNASIAATGLALAAYSDGYRTGVMPQIVAVKRTLTTLRVSGTGRKTPNPTRPAIKAVLSDSQHADRQTFIVCIQRRIPFSSKPQTIARKARSVDSCAMQGVWCFC